MRLFELRVAIVTTLKAHAGLSALLATDPLGSGVAVYDHVPQDATFPYVVVGEPIGVEHDADDIQGWDGEVTIHSWSRFRGFEEVEKIQRQVDSALHRTVPAVVDARIVTLHRTTVDGFVDEDGLTRHGIQSFRVILEET